MAGAVFRKAVGPAFLGPMRGGGVDHLDRRVVDQRHGFQGRRVGQAEDRHIGGVQRLAAAGGILALGLAEPQQFQIPPAGQPFGDLQAGGAGLPVDEHRRRRCHAGRPGPIRKCPDSVAGDAAKAGIQQLYTKPPRVPETRKGPAGVRQAPLSGSVSCRRGLPLGELEASAGLGLAVLLALDGSAVAGQEAAGPQGAVQLRLVVQQRPADAVPHRAGLAGQPAALHRGDHVVLVAPLGRRRKAG